MSLLPRLALVEDRSTASNPGKLTVQPLRYTAHFPFWPASFAGGFVTSLAWALAQPSFWPVPALILVVNAGYWLRVRLRFRFGCVNPSKVICTAPFTLAVFTDLTTGGGQYPVIKILRHPIPRGSRYADGDKCATVAMYSGAGDAEHWEDFDPVMVDCATTDRSSIETVVQSIPADEWSSLEEGIKNLPLPLKPGVYPLNCL